MNLANSSRTAWLGRPDLVRGARHVPVPNERFEEHADPGPARLEGIGGDALVVPFERGVGLRYHPLEEGEQHGILGGEVEVEGRPRQACPLGEVVHGDLGDRALGQQSPCRLENGQFAVVARRPGGPSTTGDAGLAGGCHGSYFTQCRNFQHTVDLFDTALIALQHDRICRRRHRRSRYLRHQRRLASAGPLPRQELRDPGAPRESRRHLGPVQVPGSALRFRHVHPRIPVQAVHVGAGDRRGAVDPELSEGSSRRERHRAAHAVRPERGRRRLVRRGQPLDPARRDRRAAARDQLLVPVRLHRLLQLRRGLLARVRRLARTSRARSSTRSTGPRISITKARRSLSSAAAPPPLP